VGPKVSIYSAGVHDRERDSTGLTDEFENKG
jgi:hypothetical protein